MWMLLGYFSLQTSIFDWHVVRCGSKQIPQRHMFNRDWIMSSNFLNYFTFNTEYNWEDLCIWFINQQTYTSNYHNEIKGGPIFNPIL